MSKGLDYTESVQRCSVPMLQCTMSYNDACDVACGIDL
jgi:hypothetical protein